MIPFAAFLPDHLNCHLFGHYVDMNPRLFLCLIVFPHSLMTNLKIFEFARTQKDRVAESLVRYLTRFQHLPNTNHAIKSRFDWFDPRTIKLNSDSSPLQ